MWPFLLFIIELWLTIQQQFVRVITKVNPCCKALSNFFSEHFCCSFPLVPLLNVLYCVSGCLKPLSSSYVIGAFSSPHHVSAVHHCQTGDNNDNNTRREKKIAFSTRSPLPRCFGLRGLINPEKHSVLLHWFAAADRQKAASSPRFDWRRRLIQAQMSAPEHWLLTKTKINQAHSDGARSVRLLVAVMWLLTWKIDLTASKSLCQHVNQWVRYNRIIDPTSAAWLQWLLLPTDIATACGTIKYSITASLQ